MPLTCQHLPRPPFLYLPSTTTDALLLPHDVAPVSSLYYLSSSTVDGPGSLSALLPIRVSIERQWPDLGTCIGPSIARRPANA